MDDVDREEIRKEIRDGIQNAVNLIAAQALRVPPTIAGATPAPISADEVNKVVDKRVTDTSRILAKRDEQLLRGLEAVENRINGRIDTLVQRLPTIETATAIADAAKSAGESKQELISKQDDTNTKLDGQRKAILANLILPVIIGVSTIVVNRIFPPPPVPPKTYIVQPATVAVPFGGPISVTPAEIKAVDGGLH